MVDSANSALRKSLQFWKTDYGYKVDLSLHHRYGNTKSSGASSASRTKIQVCSVSNFSQSQRALRRFHLLFRLDQHMTHTNISASVCILITQDDESISLNTRVDHHLELGVECLLQFTYPTRSIHRHQRNNTQCMSDSQSHGTLVDR